MPADSETARAAAPSSWSKMNAVSLVVVYHLSLESHAMFSSTAAISETTGRSRAVLCSALGGHGSHCSLLCVASALAAGLVHRVLRSSNIPSQSLHRIPHSTI